MRGVSYAHIVKGDKNSYFYTESFYNRIHGIYDVLVRHPPCDVATIITYFFGNKKTVFFLNLFPYCTLLNKFNKQHGVLFDS